MMLLLMILLGIYLRELRTENVYEAIKLPLFTKEGLFYDVAFSGFIRNIFERVKNGERLWAIKLPLFRKEGRFNYSNLFKINLPNPSLQKRGFFMMLLLVVLLGMYLRGLRTANIYEAIKLPPLS